MRTLFVFAQVSTLILDKCSCPGHSKHYLHVTYLHLGIISTHRIKAIRSKKRLFVNS
jgi:hypothetical protein